MRMATFSQILKKSCVNPCLNSKSVFNPALKQSSSKFSTRSFPKIQQKSFRWLLTGAVSGTFALAAYVFNEMKVKDLIPGYQPTVTAATKDSPRFRYNFIADVVEKAAPAVVRIEIHGKHPFSRQSVPVSNGSGFIVRADGLILTNAHVVANKQQVVIQLNDGRTFQGTVQAVDPVSDLATVKVNANDLPTIPLGKSSDVRPGEFVVALGNPLQLNNTVTSGIVSSTQRKSADLGIHNKEMVYLQTDAVINFGNSGGPLVNLDGEAIGINTMKVTPGISFAIPSDYAEQFLEKAKVVETRSAGSSWFARDGSQRATRRYMGISMLTLTPDVLSALRDRHGQSFAGINSGVFVHKIFAGSPAHNGGMQPGDIITRINDTEINSASDVYKIIEQQSDLRVTVLRNHQPVNLTIIAEEVR